MLATSNVVEKNAYDVALENFDLAANALELDNNLRAMIKYPEHKIKVGLTWNNKVEIGVPLPLKTENIWTLESVEDPAAVVVGDGQISTTDTTKVVTLQQGLKATTNFKGRRVVKSHVNLATGWPETSKAYAEQKGSMILLAGGQLPEDMKMQIEFSTESEYTIKKK